MSQAFAADGHEVKFLCQTHYGRTLPGVERICLKGELGHEALETLQLPQAKRAGHLASQYRRALKLLHQQGWQPELVISHSGWGCGLHIKELWPDVRQISYVEWWFNPKSALLHHDSSNPLLPMGPASAASLWRRNLTMALELTSADQLVAPTAWQRQQLPPSLQQRCEVIFDGVDQSRFRPDPTRRSTTPLLTYGTRGMEPMRCFPEFIRELPDILRRHPLLRVEIAGQDEIHYGGKPPEEGSWGRWAKQLLQREGVGDRVHWLGLLAGDAYVHWLQSSWCHVYLTQPYVASWSLVEALCCGCPLVASDVAPVHDFAGEGAIVWVDHRRPGFLLKATEALLNRDQSMIQAAQATGRTSILTSIQHWQRVAGEQVTTDA